MRNCVIAGAAAALIWCGSAGAQEQLTLPAKDAPLPAPQVLFTVGREDGSGADVFGKLAGVAFDAAGRLYVLDSQASRVVVFDAGGRVQRTFGRAGRGPGEFSRPYGIAVLPDGRVIVRDGGARGIHVFSSTGEFQYLNRISTDLPYPTGPLRLHPDGVVTETIQLGRAGGAMKELDHLPLVLQPVQKDAPARLLWKVPATPPDVKPTGTAPGAVTMRIGPPTGYMQPSWGVLPGGGLATAFEQQYAIHIVSRAGAIQRVLRRDIQPRRWTSRDRTSVERARRESLASGGARSSSAGGVVERAMSPAEIEKRIRDMELAPTISPIRRIATDSEGRIWVSRAGDVGVTDGPIDLISPELRYLGTLPVAPLPDAFGPGGLAATIVRDDLGVERVRVSRLSLR